MYLSNLVRYEWVYTAQFNLLHRCCLPPFHLSMIQPYEALNANLAIYSPSWLLAHLRDQHRERNAAFVLTNRPSCFCPARYQTLPQRKYRPLPGKNTPDDITAISHRDAHNTSMDRSSLGLENQAINSSLRDVLTPRRSKHLPPYEAG